MSNTESFIEKTACDAGIKLGHAVGDKRKNYAEKLAVANDETDPTKFIQELLMIVNAEQVTIDPELTKQLVFLDNEAAVKKAINAFMSGFASNE